MHGDETVGRELMIYLARELLDQHGSTGRLTRLVDNARIFIMPSMKPRRLRGSTSATTPTTSTSTATFLTSRPTRTTRRLSRFPKRSP